MNQQTVDLIIRRHGVLPGQGNPFSETRAGSDTVLTNFQIRLLRDSAPVRIASAPTGAGKTYAFELAPLIEKNVLFVVPTRRLAQNLEQSVRGVMQKNGWNDVDIDSRLAVWTSDAMEDAKASGLTSGKVRSKRVRQLRGQDDFCLDGSFIIATPESVGRLLLNPPPRDVGQPAMSLRDLLSRDHIVFDEFHTIEARGFGLACALCRLVSRLSGHRPHITFLSATPVDIVGALTAFDVDEAGISKFEEQVENWQSGEEPEGARIVHGDVDISLGHYADILEACRGESQAIARTLGSGRSVVVIFDSVAKLKASREDLSGIFKDHGVTDSDILTINSIDDAHHAFQDTHGVGGRGADPRQARVILATSSIEIGVTFSASLMIMDPGYDSCSFIQRVGRVSRGDLPGRVVVAGNVLPHKLAALRTLSTDRATTVGAFTAKVLSNVAGEFNRPPEELQTHGRMSNRAVWCACLFWHALGHVWTNYAGEYATLEGFRPHKVVALESKLKDLQQSGLDRPKHWVRAFICEAIRFRDIEPRVRVHHAGRTDLVPESMVGRFTEICRSPFFEDSEGLYIELPRPLEKILETGDSKPFRTTVQPLSPLDGLSLKRCSVAKDFVQELRRTRCHSFGKHGDHICNTVADLVSMTGVFPREDEEDLTIAHQGSGVV